jgi:outer membrane biosynthesis protein TonB
LAVFALQSSCPGASEEEKIPLAGRDGVTEPSIIKKTRKRPKYPREEKAKLNEARLFFEAVVQKEGTVGTAKLINCSMRNYYQVMFRPATAEACAPFESSALVAISKWRYEPARSNGEPVDVRFIIEIKFVFD